MCFLNPNGCASDRHGSFPEIFALGEAFAVTDGKDDAFDLLKQFHDAHDDWIFGFLTYDLKNQTERLSSFNHDGIMMPALHFFVPEVIIFPEPQSLRIGCLAGGSEFSDPGIVFKAIMNNSPEPDKPTVAAVTPRVSKDMYVEHVRSIKEHIQQGDIYEMNYCIEFYDQQAHINPVIVYDNLIRQSPTPFSCFYQLDGKALMCASPERFLQKTGNRLMSQPMKGTIARGTTPQEDDRQKEKLLHDPKERSENVMIVDLVRNDLSRTAKDGSVRVEELFGVYPFRNVHQMISTIVSELDERYHPADAIKMAFPMGSMTGAPKVRAMQLIEQFEMTKRGLYSGAVGYISPDKNFDFNVVIRSILYNASSHYLSYMAGSAITNGSDAEMEYEECLLKAEGMRRAIIG